MGAVFRRSSSSSNLRYSRAASRSDVGDGLDGDGEESADCSGESRVPRRRSRGEPPGGHWVGDGLGCVDGGGPAGGGGGVGGRPAGGGGTAGGGLLGGGGGAGGWPAGGGGLVMGVVGLSELGAIAALLSHVSSVGSDIATAESCAAAVSFRADSRPVGSRAWIASVLQAASSISIIARKQFQSVLVAYKNLRVATACLAAHSDIPGHAQPAARSVETSATASCSQPLPLQTP